MSAAPEVPGFEAEVLEALTGVVDPEIPTCAITDLGMVEAVWVDADRVEVTLLPTYVGCPAREMIGIDARRAVEEVAGGREVVVRFALAGWTSDRITPQGREALREFGISPDPIDRTGPARCPYCASSDTILDSSFGPTPCRSTHYCHACRNPFESFKPKRPRGRELPVTGRDPAARPHEEVAS